jgi:ribosomal protein L34
MEDTVLEKKNVSCNLTQFLLFLNVYVIKSRRMRWTGHAARMDEGRGASMILVRRPEGRNHLEDPGLDGRIILKWIFKQWDGGMDWIDMAQDRDRWRVLVNAEANLRLP